MKKFGGKQNGITGVDLALCVKGYVSIKFMGVNLDKITVWLENNYRV